ncbi:MAG: protein-export chaperone SecB [Thiotrichales bacterium]|nr:MAG: protein-export chaperone SecB [Thiotrichales bacterium]
MAEETNSKNGSQPEAQASGQGATKQEAQEQQFIIERVYVKDISFESPNSPAIFTQEWESDTNLNLNTQVNPLGEDHYEVELHLTVSVKGKDGKMAFLVEVVQAGAFFIKGYPAEQLNHLLASYCPSNLFPYAREVISNLVSKGSFPEMHLSPINFDALYAQNIAKQQEAQANGAAENSEA